MNSSRDEVRRFVRCQFAKSVISSTQIVLEGTVRWSDNAAMSRRFQFSLRGLFIVTAVAALAAWRLHLVEAERRAEIVRISRQINQIKDHQRILGPYPIPVNYQPEIDRLTNRIKELGGEYETRRFFRSQGILSCAPSASQAEFLRDISDSSGASGLCDELRTFAGAF